VAAPHIGFATVTWRMWIYVIVAIVGVGVACWSDAALSLLLFIVYPQMWIFAGDRLSTGIALNAALTVSSLCGFMTGYGEWTLDALRDIGPQMAVSLAFSVLLGIWVSRIVQQSIERGRLIAELEATRSALAGAHHEQGVMAERERLAREIHDTLAQGFTSIVMLAQAAAAGRDPATVADRLTMIEEVARDNLAEARALVAAFSPLELTGSGVAEALARLAERFGRETGLPVEVETVGEVMGLRRDQEVVLLRVVQEALTNVRRHSAAGRVRIRLVSDAEGARVEVSDDGVGFVAEETSGGFGLTGMRSRLGEVGGRLDVASAPGAGTLVRVRVPRSDEIEEEPS
jgi:signal transduction histidine kinase